MKYDLKYSFYGNKAILIEWPSIIDEDVLNDILVFKSKIEQNHLKQIAEVINAYNTILITYKIEINKSNHIFKELNDLYVSKDFEISFSTKTFQIPVCYDVEFASDLETFSKQKGLSKSEVISLHTNAVYSVYFIGFLPGFLYLGGLDERLHLDRKASPKLHVKKGSVGIGGQQTGIYPQDSPGGWHIIGNCPINLFDATKTPPCFINAGDNIQFLEIDKAHCKAIKAEMMSNNFDYKTLIKHA